MVYNARAHGFIFHGVIMCISTLSQGFHLGYLMNTVPDPYTNELTQQALAAHKTGWLASFWLLIFGATFEYCDLPEKWARRLYIILVYQAYHQIGLNYYLTYLGIMGGRLPMGFTGEPQYDFARILMMTYPAIIYFGTILWGIGVYRKYQNVKKA